MNFVPGRALPRSLEANLDRLKALMADAGQQEGPVVDTLSMINHQEQRLLYLLAADYYGHRGDIVDAGVFLGASTNCLAAGLRANPDRRSSGGPRIRSFDLCRCDNHMANLINAYHRVGLKPGDSFEDLLRRNIEGVGRDVDLMAGNIEDAEPENDIEILFFDVCKTPLTTGTSSHRSSRN